MPSLIEAPNPPRDSLKWNRALLLTLALVTLITAIRPISSEDVWQHLASGRLVAERHGPLRSDPFSCTAQGKPWIEHEWLAQLAMYLVYSTAGVNGLILAHALVVALAAAVLLIAARNVRGSSPPAAMFACALAVLAASERFFTRPEDLTFLAMALMMFAGNRIRQGELRWLWAPPLIMVFWVNVHGAWPAGLAWLGLAAAGETAEKVLRPQRAEGLRTVKALWAALGLAAIATLINPWGPVIWKMPFALSGMPEVRAHINEWLPPTAEDWLDPRHYGLYFFAVSILLAWRAPRISDWLLFAFCGYLLMSASRHFAIAAIMLAPSVAPCFEGIGGWAALRRLRRWRYAAALAICLAVAPTALGGIGLPKLGLGVEKKRIPEGAVKYLQANNLDGNLFNNYTFGNYLIFTRYPANLVFIDGRVDMYGPGPMKEYGQVCSAEGDWESPLLLHNVQCIVLWTQDPVNVPLMAALNGNARWPLLYWDDVAAVYVRADGTHSAFVESAYKYSVRPDEVQPAMLRDAASLARAEADYRRKCSENPNCAMATYGLALCLDTKGFRSEALQLLEDATLRHPDILALHYALSIMYERNGDVRKALNAALRAKAIDPHNQRAIDRCRKLEAAASRAR